MPRVSSALNPARADDDDVHVLIADDHRLVIEGVKLKLGELETGMTFTVAMTVAELDRALEHEAGFDLAVIDLTMPGAVGFSHIEAARREHPTLPIIVLSGSDDPSVMRAVLDLGVLGFIPKAYSPEVMLSAVRLVMSGGVYIPPMIFSAAAGGHAAMPVTAANAALHAAEPAAPASIDGLKAILTERQIDVLQLLSNGKPNKLIARELGISEGTVKIHLAAIFRALNVRNRTEAVVIARKLTGA